jgi:hypothetical protein
MVGGLYLTNGAKIDASAGTNLLLNGIQTIPDGAFVGDTVPISMIDNLGVTTEGSLPITGTLNLSNNPSDTK